MKIGFIASSGGHLEELVCLKEIEEKYESFLVTEKGEFQEVRFGDNKYYTKQINRKEKFFLLHFLGLFIKALCILIKEKPDVIITTGALVSYPFCVIAKLFRHKIIYIESFARIDTPSMTGKMVYPFADLFIVQWEELLEFYPKAKLTGGIF